MAFVFASVIVIFIAPLFGIKIDLLVSSLEGLGSEAAADAVEPSPATSAYASVAQRKSSRVILPARPGLAQSRLPKRQKYGRSLASQPTMWEAGTGVLNR